MRKYCTDSSYGTVDNKRQLDLSDDVARVKWGGSWRMPTLDEARELLNNTTSTWTSVNGVSGRRFMSKTNGNSIFLPAAGGRWDGSADGYYWSSTFSGYDPSDADGFGFDSGGAYWGGSDRRDGLSVRPVR